MHVQTIFLIEKKKATCFSELLLFGLYIKILPVCSQFADFSSSRRVWDQTEGIRFNAPPFFLTMPMSSLRGKIQLVHFVVLFTLSRVASVCVVYLGFSTKKKKKKKGDDEIGASLSRGK